MVVVVALLLAALLVAALSVAASRATPLEGHGRNAVACGPVFFGVPGSGQGVLNPAPSGRPAGISADDARRYGTSIARVKNVLMAAAGPGVVAARALSYPAISTDKYLGITGLSHALEVSEKQGVTALVRAIHSTYRGGCRERPVLLAGYSQGAEVVVRTVRALPPAQRRHVTVALLGNPSFRPKLPGDYPRGLRASGLRPNFEDGQAYLLPAEVRARTIDVCAPGDSICGVDPDAVTLLGRLVYVLRHTRTHARAYAHDEHGYATAAGRFLWRHRTR